MLNQHKYYVYSDEEKVMARMDDRAPVVVKVCEPEPDAEPFPLDAKQVAAAFVEQLHNPDGLKHDHKSLWKDKKNLGFNHPDHQAKISDRSKEVVLAAYGENA